jgi:hypothetical protein
MTQSKKVPGSGMKIQIIIMLVMVVGATVLGTVMLPKNEAERAELMAMLGTTNMGTLISPTVNWVPLLPVGENTSDDINGHYRVVLVADGQCDSGCQEMLAATRAVEVRLGRDARRVDRILLQHGLEPAVLADIEAANPDLAIAALDSAALAALLAPTTAQLTGANRYYLINPVGDAVLYYDEQNSGSDLLEDLKHLLKYSPSR